MEYMSDRTAEQALIGSILRNNNLFIDTVGNLDKDDFYYLQHNTIFEAMAKMYKKGIPIDIITLGNSLGTEHLTSIGGISYLSSLASSIETTLNFKTYLKIIKNLGAKRKIIKGCYEVIEKSKEDIGAEQLAEDLQNRLILSSSNKTKTLSIAEVLEQSIDKVIELSNNGGGIPGITTGYKELDKAINGLNPGDLIILAGRPSMGKTALSLNIIDKIPKENNVLFFELEMSPAKVGIRLMASRGRVRAGRLSYGKVNDKELERMEQGARELIEKGNIYLNDKAGISLSEIGAEAKRIKLQHGLSVIVIDHIGLMTPDNKKLNKNDQIGAVTDGLKKLAKELNVCVIALSQLNRSVESRTEKRPTLSDLRDSGNIEQDADVVLLLYRDDYYNKTDENAIKSELEINIAKNRDGETGHIKLAYYRDTQLIDNL